MDTSGSVLLSEATWPLSWMPYRPRATDDFETGAWPMSRPRALERRYVEHSPKALVGALVVDCDHADAAMRAFEQPSDHPAPNWVAQSPSGRAHLGWFLRDAVCRTDLARMAPLRYAAKVQEGLRRSVDGDPAYVNVFTKNPVHPDWLTIWGRAEPYSLADLCTVHTPRSLPKKESQSAGLGRHVTMFDHGRLWAYSAHRQYVGGSPDDWERAVLQRCHAINHEFEAGIGGSLPFTHVQSTAQSIARWVWRNFRPFSEVQADRGRIGGRKSGTIMTEKKREANRVRATKFARNDVLELAL